MIMEKTLETFLQAVSDFHQNDFEHRVQFLRERQLPCGLFFPYGAETLQPFLDWFTGMGLRLSLIVTIGGELPELPVSVLPAENFPDARKPAVMFLPNAAFSYAFAPFFRRYHVESLILTDMAPQRAMEDFYIAHLADLYKAYACLSDETSRQTFLGGWKAKSSSSPSDYKVAPETQYFLEGFTVRPGDVVIDGGAFDGETGRQFAQAAGASGRVYAFEMDEENFQKCQEAAGIHGFVAENLGLSSRRETAQYKHTEIASASSKCAGGDHTARFVSIDAYAEEHGLPRIDFIKMDIEGAELDALHGAEASIRRWKPRMAICAYHKPEDLWTLAHYIKSLHPDYEFAFRHYATPIEDNVFDDAMRGVVDQYQLPRMVTAAWEHVLYCR